MKIFNRIIFIALAITSILSCKPGRTLQSVSYLNNLNDSAAYSKVIAFEPVIQRGDKISITVTGLEPTSAAQFNQTPPIASGAPGGAIGGYIVDQNGTINFPQLGRLKIEGLTREGLVNLLTDSLIRYVMKPLVSVQFQNFKVTVLGEVNRPGTIPLPEGKINLIEAIGLSGDLTMYGNRQNVLIVREIGAKRQLARVDLTNTNIFSSPYYNLQQNDVVYVEMIEQKLKATDQAEARNNIGILTSIASVTASLIAIIITITR